MRHLTARLGPCLVLGAIAILQLSCSSEPTGTSTPSPGGPSFYDGQFLSVSGPNQIIPTTYTAFKYTAYMGASYPTFYPWGVRFCPTLSVTNCTATWASVRGTTKDTYWNFITPSLKRDCTGGGTKSYQVRAQASAFATPTETVYKVTKLCPDI